MGNKLKFILTSISQCVGILILVYVFYQNLTGTQLDLYNYIKSSTLSLLIVVISFVVYIVKP